eukprot:TRINITY_DN2524_c0_g1_i1.p1 TRINITY_DN2524_c0_g1~~TRINITY_DN2524_c0_g1_i1.p1  ORF type:complete len:755 (+),score=145.26 TRINITY_DN2524_c0_g1_i1:14-2278(+)
MNLPKINESNNPLVYIAIDFGTSYSGFAIAFKTDGPVKPLMPKQYPDAPSDYFKTLTQISYLPNGRTLWGWPAKYHAEDFDGDQDKLFKYFKMDLKNDCMSTDVSGTLTVPTEEIISKFLSSMIEFIEVYWDEAGLSPPFHDCEKSYCLTVPAIWENNQKDIMMKICEEIGIYDPSDEYSKLNFQFALEPEAAATYIFDMMRREGRDIQPEETFLVVDCGGGTIDLTSHKAVLEKGSLKLEEITVGSGNDFGSMKLDENFHNFLARKFGDSDWMDKLSKQSPSALLDLATTWETFKCSLHDLDTPRAIRLPLEAKNFVPSSQWRGGRLQLSADELHQIFDPVLQPICELVGNHLKNYSGKFDYIFMVGGFSESTVLYETLRAGFKQHASLDFIRPNLPGQSIVRGAILLAADESVISARRMRKTYGVKCYKPFDPNVHDISKKVPLRGKSGHFCEDVFDTLVEVGERVAIDKVIIREYRSAAESLNLEFYESLDTNIPYVDYPGSDFVGNIVVSNIQPDTLVEVKVEVGKSCLGILATDSMGNSIPAQIFYGSTLTSDYPTQQMTNENVHVIFCNDTSGSMSSTDMVPTKPSIKSLHNNRVGALYEAVERILLSMDSSIKVSGIVYQSNSTVIFNDQPASPNLLNYFMGYSAGGGTKFFAAMNSVKQLVTSYSTKYICIFMSDGECGNEGTTDLTRQLCSQYDFTCHCVSVGSNSQVLQEIAAAGNGMFLRCDANLDKLVETYQTILAGILEGH